MLLILQSNELEEVSVVVNPLQVFHDIFGLLFAHVLIWHAKVEVFDDGLDIWFVEFTFGIERKFVNPFFALASNSARQIGTGRYLADDVTAITAADAPMSSAPSTDALK